MGLNVACVSGRLDTILWEAARSGWRDGYSAESPAAFVQNEPEVAGYSRYILSYGADLTSRLEAIARARVSLKLGRMFDWELQLEDSIAPELVEQMLDECKAAGKPAQYIGFTSGKLPSGEDWLTLSRRQNCGLSFSGMDADLAALGETARTLGGRFNYRAGAAANPAALFG